jgi:hypothetical protein
MTAITTAVSMMQANAQASAQNAAMKRDAEAANRSAIDQNSAMIIRGEQLHQAAAQESLATTRQAAEARGTMKAMNAESGIGGVTMDALLADVYRQELDATSVIDANLKNQLLQDDLTRRGIRANAESRTNAARASMSNGVSPVTAALQIGSGLTSSYVKYQASKPQQ